MLAMGVRACCPNLPRSGATILATGVSPWNMHPLKDQPQRGGTMPIDLPSLRDWTFAWFRSTGSRPWLSLFRRSAASSVKRSGVVPER